MSAFFWSIRLMVPLSVSIDPPLGTACAGAEAVVSSARHSGNQLADKLMKAAKSALWRTMEMHVFARKSMGVPLMRSGATLAAPVWNR
ncbi:hypothetical protein PTKU15_59140 [Paraburkholderia terrae]|nr:hypothetical protein PTKU15_59140 [Paraburkholderia terrae]